MQFESFAKITLVILIVYLLESFAITFAIYMVAKKSLTMKQLSCIFITIATTILILDVFAPEIGLSARQGHGFAAGFTLVGGDGPKDYAISASSSNTGDNLEELNTYGNTSAVYQKYESE